MGFLDPKPVTPAALDSHPRLSAAALSATYGGAVRVSKYGTGSAAFVSAAAEAGEGGTIFLPKAAGPYTLTTPIVLADVNIDSDGALINVPASFEGGPETAAITLDSPAGNYSAMTVRNFKLVGPGNRTVGVKTANAVGIRVNRRSKPTFDHVEVRYFDKGVALNNELGHIYFVNATNINNNYYGAYLETNNNDYLFDKCEINGNTFANFGSPADQGWGALVVADSHVGYAPYSFYQEAGPVAQGANKPFLSTATFDNARFEQCGNAAIWSDATVDATNYSIASSLDIFNPGFSWGDEATYRVMSRPKTHSVYLPQTSRHIEIINGDYPFLSGDGGTSSPIHIKKAGHSAFRIFGQTAAVTDVTVDSGSRDTYAHARPVDGLLTHNGNLADPVLSFGSSTGFMRPGSSDLRRFGADTAYLYADFNNDFRWRNSGAGNALIGRLTTYGIAMPKYYIGTAGATTGPNWSSGTGAPATTEPNGSTYTRTDGGPGTTFYRRVNGTWVSDTDIKVPVGSTAAQIQALIDGAAEGSELTFGPFQFNLSTQLVINKSIKLKGTRGLNGTTTSGTRFTVAAGVQTGIDGALKITGSYVTIEGITIEGAGYASGSAGIRVQGVGAVHAHAVEIIDCTVRQFGTGVAMGVNSDHVSLHRTKVSGNNHGVNFEVGNMFDYGFFDCLLEGNVTSSLHLDTDASVANVTCVRSHLGFSQYGVLQEATATGNGFAGLSLIDSPIESVSVQHMKVINGGHIRVQGGYWLWTDTPANPAFSIENVNSGPIWLNPRLEPNTPNANSPALFTVVTSAGHPVYIDGPLNGFAQTRYTSPGLQKNIFLDGLPAGGTAAPTAGTWARGDRIRNTAPSIGSPTGWVCVTAGTPGTWGAEPNLV